VERTWRTTRILFPLPTSGDPITINGEDAHIELERPGSCDEIGGDETLNASIPLGPSMTRQSNIVLTACLRGPNVAVNERLVRQMLTSIVIAP